MIPQFPKFKKLELSDKQDVEKITHKYPPYSDFNFVSMWSWDIKGEMRISQFYGNLVVRFTDYLTGKPFYSFLGDNKVNETANTLLKLSEKEGLMPELKLVPEDSIKNLDNQKFLVKEDRDNFDYIFDLRKISTYEGAQFMKKRNKLNQFLRLFPSTKIQVINIKDKNIKEKILKLDEFWLNNKTKKDPNFRIKNEFLATKRFSQSDLDDVFSAGIFIDKNLIGYSIVSVASNSHTISHFTKADTKFTGVYDFLMRESAKILLEKKHPFLNFEQDLGLLGLRESKKSFMSKYLKKFTVGFAS